MTRSPMDAPALIDAARTLVPLLRATAREAELARRPLDEVIDAVRASGLFSLMVPKRYGGHEADLDTFFEVVLALSQADASMGWLIGFYIEHNFWLGLTAGLPLLGAAQMALAEYRSRTKTKLAANQLRAGGFLRDEGKPSVVARAALSLAAAELLFRDVLADVMAQRDRAPLETRSAWMARLAHAVFMCRDAVQDISSVTGASGSRLDNPIQRALRDIATAANHVVFDRESRYADYGRLLLDQPIQNLMV